MQRAKVLVSTLMLAAAASLPAALSSSAVQAAENCLSAPKGAAPEGRHWYYRTDRAAQRKCWYLGSAERDGAKEATRSARNTPSAKSAPEPADDAESNSDNTPAATTAIAKPAAPAMVTRNASDVTPNVVTVPVVVQKPEPVAEPAAQAPEPVVAQPAAETSAAAPASPPEPARAQPIAAAAQPPASAPSRAPAAETPSSPLHFIFLAIALIGLAGGAVVYVAEIRRRRSDVLSGLPLDIAPPPQRVRTIIDAPSSPPLSPRDITEFGAAPADETLQWRRRQRSAA